MSVSGSEKEWGKERKELSAATQDVSRSDSLKDLTYQNFKNIKHQKQVIIFLSTN